jgi:hypothetical protein
MAAMEPEENQPYKWEFASSTPEVFDENTKARAGDDGLGEKIDCLKVWMDKVYIGREEIVPGDPMTRTFIRKPGIYNAARKIEKHLKKQVKKGNMDAGLAAHKLAHILEVSISALDEPDTQSFEAALDEVKNDIDSQTEVFMQVRLINIYLASSKTND